jgi:hypothetical protein
MFVQRVPLGEKKQLKIMRQIKKRDLPSKLCMVCNRPFSWRKKWETVWEEVKYCSDACRKKKNKS